MIDTRTDPRGAAVGRRSRPAVSRYLQLHTPSGSVWAARWAACFFGVVQLLVYSPAGAVMTSQTRMIGFALLVPLVVLNVVEWRSAAWLYQFRPTLWPMTQIVVEFAVVAAMAALFSFDATTPLWSLFCLPILHSAMRFRVPGALLGWGASVVLYIAVSVIAEALHGVGWNVFSVTYRAGILLIIGLATGFMSSGLNRRMEQVAALEAVAGVTQRMTAMNAATLVDEVTSAAHLVGFSEVQVFTLNGEPGYWASAAGSSGAAGLDEDPAEVHMWCADLAARIAQRNRPMYMRPQDGLVSYRHLDWGSTQVLVVPIRAVRDVFGLIIATHPDPVPGYRLKTLKLLAAHAGAALANARRYADKERFERELTRQATHDGLTKLPNRVLLNQRLEATLRRTKGSDVRTAVLLLDLDRFKDVNDTLGHAYGDALLVQVAQRLTETLRSGDVAARLGGDEFAVLATGFTDVDDAVAMAKRVLAGVHRPFNADGVTLDVEVSIGVAVSPDHGATVEDLLRCADVAMYTAKRSTLGVHVYDQAEDLHTPKRLSLLGDMRRALDDSDQLKLYYQPAMDTHSRQIVGAEALLRWQHPTQGLVAPEDFVPGAEGTGLIHQLTNYVIRAAIAQCRTWLDAGTAIPVAVNVSTRCLLDLTLPVKVQDLLSEYGLSPEWLRLEITESSIMADPERALSVLRELDSLGVRMSIDDFGTGYSSMSYLKHLPVDEIKIDKSFVQAMNEQRKDQLLVASLVELGHNLGLKVVAEGVENGTILSMLQKLGCDKAQGYYIARPMEAAAFDAWRSSGEYSQRLLFG